MESVRCSSPLRPVHRLLQLPRPVLLLLSLRLVLSARSLRSRLLARSLLSVLRVRSSQTRRLSHRSRPRVSVAITDLHTEGIVSSRQWGRGQHDDELRRGLGDHAQRPVCTQQHARGFAAQVSAIDCGPVKSIRSGSAEIMTGAAASAAGTANGTLVHSASAATAKRLLRRTMMGLRRSWYYR